MQLSSLFFACFILISQQAVKPAGKKEHSTKLNLDYVFLYSKIKEEILNDELAHAARLGFSHDLYLKVMKVPTAEEKKIAYTKFCKDTFKSGYEYGCHGFYLDALDNLKKIPYSSTLYPKSQKLISFFSNKHKKMIDVWEKEYDKKNKQTRVTRVNCVDPKYGCHGTDNCKKCTDCSRCRHCNDHNGSCGVCR